MKCFVLACFAVAQVLLKYVLPLSEVVTDFYDELKVTKRCREREGRYELKAHRNAGRQGEAGRQGL